MSYILDALKKAEQQRHNKGIPSLPAMQPVAPTRHKTTFAYYSLVVLILLGAGIAIGWMKPWQTEHSAGQVNLVKAPSPIDSPKMMRQEQPNLLENPSEVASTALLIKAPKIDPQPQLPQQAQAKTKLLVSSSVAETVGTPQTLPSDAAQQQSLLSLSELPSNLQQEIPPLQIQMHAYSSNPNNRLVSINSKMLHEGDALTPELRLEKISSDGMIFSYKGYRFHHGIQ